jgi:hypothetical protein
MLFFRPREKEEGPFFGQKRHKANSFFQHPPEAPHASTNRPMVNSETAKNRAGKIKSSRSQSEHRAPITKMAKSLQSNHGPLSDSLRQVPNAQLVRTGSQSGSRRHVANSCSSADEGQSGSRRHVANSCSSADAGQSGSRRNVANSCSSADDTPQSKQKKVCNLR